MKTLQEIRVLVQSIKALDEETAVMALEVILSKIEEDVRLRFIANQPHKQAYVNHSSAEAVKKVVDEMIASGKNKYFFYEDFPNYSSNTVRHKIDGGLRQLVMTDKTGKYTSWRKSVKTKRLPHAYAIIFRTQDEPKATLDENELVARELDEPEVQAAPTLSGKAEIIGTLAEFISSNKPHIKITGISLTVPEIEQINNLFEGVRNMFEIKVVTDRVIVLRKEIIDEQSGINRTDGTVLRTEA